MAQNGRPLIRLAAYPAIVVVAVLVVVGGQGGCGDDDPTGPIGQDFGAVTLEFHVAAPVGAVAFTLAGPDGFSRAGEVVATNGIATTTVDNLAVGDGYHVTASATAADGSRCERTSSSFSVAANQTGRVSLSLTCQHTGGPRGDGGLNLCPLIDAIIAGADRAYVGSSVQITGSGSDSDGPAPLSFLWTTTSGTLGDASAPDVTFTCTTAGAVTLTLTVSDGDATAGCPASSSITVTCVSAIERIGHIVVIYMENHSFDNLYGGFPGVDGLSSPTANVPQIDDATGLPYPTLPQVDPKVPLDLPNRPFDLSQYVPTNQKTVDLVHRFYQQQQQINGGQMNRFVTVSDAKGLVLAFYPTAMLPVAQLALDNPTQSTVCDRFFHAAFGGSFLNHHWLIAAATPIFPNAPASVVAVLDAGGKLVTDGAVSPDGFVVNGLEPWASPHAAGASPATLVPPQLAPTIGDRLSAAGVDWAWYAGGWDDALAGNPDSTFGPGHQPFAYYATYADGTAARAAHLKDDNRLAAEIATGTLPPVAFVKPVGLEDEHPGIADLLTGQNYAAGLIDSLMRSSFWRDTVVILTYDENGGFWDHVPPPVVDPWGPGTRVPTVIFSPFAKGGVDSTVYDTTAILKLIETRWNLPPLGERDAAQADLSVHALRLAP